MDLLRETLEHNKDLYIQYLTDLVSIDTHDIGHGIEGGLEKKGQEYMEKLFKEMGATNIQKDNLLEATIEESYRCYQEGNLGHNYVERYNLYATFKGGRGKSIMFNGHIDTMPADEALWATPPHTPCIKDGKIFGLGVCDMKGGLMASTMAVKLLQDAAIDLPGDVLITSVADEEGGGNGSIIAAMNGLRADAVVVCEPTNKELIAAHMGFVFFKVEVEGKANHSGAKWLGVSAIEKAIKLINGLTKLEEKWLTAYKHSLLPAPSLNVGTIQGGSAGSTVPGMCSFEVCIHYLPGSMNYNMVEREFRDTITKISRGDEWLKEHQPKVTMYQCGQSFEMETTHPFVKVFSETYRNIYNKEINLVGSPAGCDSRIWKNIAKCPTLQYGPGRLEQCHAVNEHLVINDYLEAILIYAKLILSWCNSK